MPKATAATRASTRAAAKARKAADDDEYDPKRSKAGAKAKTTSAVRPKVTPAQANATSTVTTTTRPKPRPRGQKKAPTPSPEPESDSLSEEEEEEDDAEDVIEDADGLRDGLDSGEGDQGGKDEDEEEEVPEVIEVKKTGDPKATIGKVQKEIKAVEPEEYAEAVAKEPGQDEEDEEEEEEEEEVPEEPESMISETQQARIAMAAQVTNLKTAKKIAASRKKRLVPFDALFQRATSEFDAIENEGKGCTWLEDQTQTLLTILQQAEDSNVHDEEPLLDLIEAMGEASKASLYYAEHYILALQAPDLVEKGHQMVYTRQEVIKAFASDIHRFGEESIAKITRESQLATESGRLITQARKLLDLY